jgi:hypothetical protein
MQPSIQLSAQGEEMTAIVGPIHNAGIVRELALVVAGEEDLGRHPGLSLETAQALGERDQSIERRVEL